jgi:hypothetical protein
MALVVLVVLVAMSLKKQAANKSIILPWPWLGARN